MANRFGVEIEVVGIYNNSAPSVLSGRPDGCGGEFLVVNEGYNSYQARPHWKSVVEYSIIGAGCEIISPPLEMNDDSFTKVKTILDYIRAAGGEMTDACGLHVHLDATELDYWHRSHVDAFFELLIEKYAENEAVFDSFVARTRRQGSNYYCKSMVGKTLQNVFYDREHKLNPVSYMKHGTVEFRHFHGTLNGEALVAWIKVINKFFDNVLAKYKRENANLAQAKVGGRYYEYSPRFTVERQIARGQAAENYIRSCEAA